MTINTMTMTAIAVTTLLVVQVKADNVPSDSAVRASVYRTVRDVLPHWHTSSPKVSSSRFGDGRNGDITLNGAIEARSKIVDLRSAVRIQGGERIAVESDGRASITCRSVWLLRAAKGVREKTTSLILDEHFSLIERDKRAVIVGYSITDNTASVRAAATERLDRRRKDLFDVNQKLELRLTRGIEMCLDYLEMGDVAGFWSHLLVLHNLGATKDSEAKGVLRSLVQRIIRLAPPTAAQQIIVNEFIQ